MAIRSGFFNSVNGDRKYDASRFAEYFASFLGNGVFPNPSDNLQVIANNNMTITVKPGKAWINGYIMINDDDYILTLDTADGILDRIDRIVVRYDTADREIRIEVKKGGFSSSPTAPDLQRDADAYELALADIYIAAGTTSITQANITDLRLNTELCGIVHGTVEQVDTTTLFNQYQAWLQETQNTAQNDIDNLQTQLQQDWDTWFQTIQTALEGDVAGNLLNLIEEHKNDQNNPHNVTAEQIGAETPEGAQAKVNALAGEGNTKTVKQLDEDLTSHKNDIASHQGVPTGVITMWSGSLELIPDGWALCDGENGTPDLRDRFIVGVGGDYEIGDTGGLDSVTLTLSQLPSHSHGSGTLSTSSAGSHSHGSGTLSTNTTGSHTHTYTSHKNSLGAEGTKENKVNLGSHSFSTSSSGSHNHSISGSTASAGSHSHSVTGSTSTAGGGSSHENRPPYYALAFIMKL